MDLHKLKELAEAATPGKWQVIVDRHPHYRGGHHIERRIATKWIHGQLNAPYPVVNSSVGIPLERGGEPYHFVYLGAENASFIAAANPSTVLELIGTIESLRARDQQLSVNADHVHIIKERLRGLALKTCEEAADIIESLEARIKHQAERNAEFVRLLEEDRVRIAKLQEERRLLILSDSAKAKIIRELEARIAELERQLQANGNESGGKSDSLAT